MNGSIPVREAALKKTFEGFKWRHNEQIVEGIRHQRVFIDVHRTNTEWDYFKVEEAFVFKTELDKGKVLNQCVQDSSLFRLHRDFF